MSHGEIVTALKLAREAPIDPTQLAETTYFVVPELATRWPELLDTVNAPRVTEISPSRWGPAENIWIVSTYLRLRRLGANVRITATPADDAVNVCFDDRVLRAASRHSAFLVVTQADRWYREWGDFEVVQTPARAVGERRCLIDHWPQPGLLPRDAGRGTRVERIGYTGHPGNLAPEFYSTAFRHRLAAIGAELVLGSDPAAWSRFHDLDAHLAVRHGAPIWIRTKPATKLVHSWLVGCPGLLGPEPSYQYWGRDGEDYIEVSTPDDALAAIHRLRESPELYRRLCMNGRVRAEGRDEAGVERQWLAMLGGPVRREFERWRTASRGRRLVRRIRRSWDRYAAPCSRRLFFVRGYGWGESLRRVFRRIRGRAAG